MRRPLISWYRQITRLCFQVCEELVQRLSEMEEDYV